MLVDSVPVAVAVCVNEVRVPVTGGWWETVVLGADEVSWWSGGEGKVSLDMEVLAVPTEFGVCVVLVSGGVVCVGCVPVFGMWGDGDEEPVCLAVEVAVMFSGCVGVMSRWVVGVTEDVVEGAAWVEKVVSGRDGVGKAVVVRKEVPEGGPVVWAVLGTVGVGTE